MSSIGGVTRGEAIEISVNVLKKKLNFDEAQHAQLLDSIPQAPAPAHLGRSVNTYA